MRRQLALLPIRAADVDGLGMGVLSDGTAYLTGRGLAEACGVAPSVILTLDSEWSWNDVRKRSRLIADILEEMGFRGESLHFKTVHGGREINAHPDVVCMAVLRYYADHAGGDGARTARRYFNRFAQEGIRQFVYRALGYDPGSQATASLRQWEDRLLINNSPPGFFSVFAELSTLVLRAIKCGLEISDHSVPDISVGMAWSKEWESRGLGAKYGERLRHAHRYPDYYPQGRANDRIEPWVYPTIALGEFRSWLETDYLNNGFTRYLDGRVRKRLLRREDARSIAQKLKSDGRLIAPTMPPTQA